MGFDADDVRRAAALARLDLTDDEAETLAGQLAQVLARIEALDLPPGDRSGGASGDGPAGGVAASAPLRSDEPGADPLAWGPGSFAPGWIRGFFTVPRLASHAGEGPESEQEAVP